MFKKNRENEIENKEDNEKSQFEEKLEKAYKKIKSFETIFGSNGNSLLINNDIYKIINCNKKVYVSFKFDWENYNSWIVIKGEDDRSKYKIKTPQIPLIGGCWSNFVATRCMTGQILISAMLQSVTIQLRYLARNSNNNTEIITSDNCFYGPFLYYMVDENGIFCRGFEKNVYKEYNNILKTQNPKAYKQVCELKEGENYWDKFHDRFSD